MIAFIGRFFLLLFLFVAFAMNVLIFTIGQPTEETWSFLWKNTTYELPIIGIIAIVAFSMSFCIALWMSIVVKIRENNTTRYVKKIAEPDFAKSLKKTSGSLKKALRDANELIETQRTSLQRLSHEKVETNDAIVQERLLAERQRLARELHDSVSQQLFAASMLLSALTEQEENEKAQKQLGQVEKIVQQAQLEMRALLLHLRPVALHNKSLAEGLEDLILELQEKVYFNIDYQIEEIALTKAEEDHLFRIAQEALSNTLRHAKASEVELLFIARDQLAILRIQDNGLGFDVEGDKTTSYGLRNIAERAVEIGCTVKIISVPDEGTLVEVKVPLIKEEPLND
ncbi:sensor histidine kinase [Lysinibacillus sp. 2017]|uniref:sensor histidine kinase n=1 Tax=unclassified Lysinibacillus TaxID=2636778 RepID=UPI000D528B23|nr:MULTISPECIES: sensor histidine kinase [unclassified Lysinibacillus]AWE06855.1 sensor histidine kinase [Lysinibacillus sp. 2017]TGN37214.1 sensor histidine kinase [Lysinibacillus sp. S2017]